MVIMLKSNIFVTNSKHQISQLIYHLGVNKKNIFLFYFVETIIVPLIIKTIFRHYIQGRSKSIAYTFNLIFNKIP